MGFIEKNLMDGERIMYRAYLHWIIFMRPAVLFIVFLFLIICAGAIPSQFNLSNILSKSLSIVSIIVLLVALISSISALIAYCTSEFGVTNSRVIMKQGFILRNSIEILLNKIEAIQVNQNITGRILNYGSIIISGTGGSKDPYHRISSPLKFRKKIQELV